MKASETRYRDATDNELLSWSAKGDRQAFNTFARRIEAAAHAMCLRLARDHEEARDLLQEVLVKAWRSAATFDQRAAARTWIYRIIVNASIDFRRTSSRRPQTVDWAGLDSVHRVPSPEHAVVSSTLVREALALLPPEYRTTVVLADCLQWTYEEIAEACAVPLGTVKSRLARARAALRDLLTKAEAR